MNKNTVTLLKFGLGNAKLKAQIHTFTLPSGYTCRGAKECLTWADKVTGQITDGRQQTYRCYAASMEARLRPLRAKGWHNLELLKACGGDSGLMTDLIHSSLPVNARIVRVHVGGDFFSNAYFQAWMRVARRNPEIRFYAYTKSLPFWIENEIPDNFKLTASTGGKYDSLIAQHSLKTACVVFSIEEAAALGLQIDHDDSHAYDSDASFALLIHGTQPKGSAAGRAVVALDGVGSYSTKE